MQVAKLDTSELQTGNVSYICIHIVSHGARPAALRRVRAQQTQVPGGAASVVPPRRIRPPSCSSPSHSADKHAHGQRAEGGGRRAESERASLGGGAGGERAPCMRCGRIYIASAVVARRTRSVRIMGRKHRLLLHGQGRTDDGRTDDGRTDGRTDGRPVVRSLGRRGGRMDDGWLGRIRRRHRACTQHVLRWLAGDRCRAAANRAGGARSREQSVSQPGQGGGGYASHRPTRPQSVGGPETEPVTVGSAPSAAAHITHTAAATPRLGDQPQPVSRSARASPVPHVARSRTRDTCARLHSRRRPRA